MTQSYNLSQLANNLNTAGQLDATDGLVGAVPPANGGTGQASYTTGDILYASGTTALAKLSDVATGNVLISGGTGTAPSYGKVGLTTHVSGTLAVANGGTGATTLTANTVLLGNGTSALQTVAPSTSGNVLTSNGTTWVSSTPTTGIGVGQTWQNVTSSRSFGTTYTNSTGKPIMVAVTSANGQFTSLSGTIDGVVVQESGGSWQAGASASRSSMSLIIPNSSTYSFSQSISSGGGGAATWFELR